MSSTVPPAAPPEAIPPRHSRVEMTEIVLPSHANNLGTAFGGQVMAWMDVAAAVAAARHARKVAVTASVDEIQFLEPVRRGDAVVLRAEVSYVGRTSMEVAVTVDAEDLATGRTVRTAEAFFTFVAVDGEGRPTPVPPLFPETEDEHRRYREGAARAEERRQRRRHGGGGSAGI